MPMSQVSSGAKRSRRGQRPRSVPHKAPFISAILLTASFYLCLVGMTASLFAFFVREDLTAACVLIGFLATAVVLWILCYFKRRNARCPLCKGTPFLDSPAHSHTNAKRYFPLNYGTTNIVKAIIFQRYRCQYCGTPFDLLKHTEKQARHG